MPNHCSNALLVEGQDANEFFDQLATATTDNFIEHFVPMPKEIRDLHRGSTTIDGVKVNVWRTDADGNNVAVPDIDLQHMTDIYGTADWYDWAVENWSTKWGSYSVDINKDGILFDSAWSPPYNAIQKISAMFPEAIFTLAYAEGGSCYYGLSEYQGGFLIGEEEHDDFWAPTEDEDEDDPHFGVTDNCRAHLDRYGLHCGG